MATASEGSMLVWLPARISCQKNHSCPLWDKNNLVHYMSSNPLGKKDFCHAVVFSIQETFRVENRQSCG